jgi:glutathione S-transferase
VGDRQARPGDDGLCEPFLGAAGGTGNAALAKSTWEEISAAFNVLNTALGKSRWLAGNDFSVADLNVASALYRALSFDLAKWPNVNEWLHRCWDRPAGKKARAMRE